MKGRWLSDLPTIQSCLLFLQLMSPLLHLPVNVDGLKVFQSRSVILGLLGSEDSSEERLYLEMCEQSSDAGQCLLAIDNYVIKEWTQCASTSEETHGWWKAQLETPSYISRVVIHTAELPDAAMRSALNDFVLLANGSPCYRHVSSRSFTTRSFPCDSFGDQLMIQSYRAGAVMSLCEVEVYGKRVLFQGLDSGESELGYQSCDQSSIVGEGSCDKALDRNFALFHGINGKICVETSPGEQYRPAWWVVFLPVPALIKHVKVYNRADSCCNNRLNKFVLKVNEVKCALPHESNQPFLTKVFSCTRFGSNIKVEATDESIGLILCQVQAFGYKMLMMPDWRINYLGCFKDNPQQPDFEEIVSYSFMTLRKCHRMCKRLSKLYFGVQNGQVCMCGNKYGRHGKADKEDACNLRCNGITNPEDNTACGGRNHTSVFEILL